MSMHSMTMGRCHVVRWGTPTLGDVRQIAVEIKNAAATSKQKLLCMAIVDNETTPPETSMLGNFDMRPIFANAEKIHFVVAAHGFKASIFRSVLIPIKMKGRFAGNAPVEIHDSVSAALAHYPPDIDLARLIEAGAKHGVFTPSDALEAYRLPGVKVPKISPQSPLNPDRERKRP